MKPKRPLNQHISEATVMTLGEHVAEWYEQGEMLMLTDPLGREQVQLSREEAYLLLSLLLASFQQDMEDE